MRKSLIAGTLGAVIIIVASLLVLNLNALITRHKDYLIAQLEQSLGRKIRVGDVEATFWNGIGVRLANFAVSEDPAYGSDDFVRARDLQVNFKFWPLLKRQVQVKRLILHEPVIRVVRAASREFNFATIGVTASERPEQPAGPEKPRHTVDRPPDRRARPVPIPSVDILGGELRFSDRAKGADLRLSLLDLRVEHVDFNQPIAITLAAALHADKQNFTVKGRIGPLPADGDWQATPVDGRLNVEDLDLALLKNALSNALAKNFDVSGPFQLKDLRFHGSIKDLAVSGAIDASRAAVRYGRTFHKPAGVPLTASMQGRYAGKRVALSQSLAKLDNLEVSSAGAIDLSDGIAVNLSIKTTPASMDGWERFLPGLQPHRLRGRMDLEADIRGKIGKGSTPQLHGTMTLKNASVRFPGLARPVENLDAIVKFSGQRADARDMTLSLGKSRIGGSLAIERFEPLTVSYKLATPELRPADYKLSVSDEHKADIIRNLQSEGQFIVGAEGLIYKGKLGSAAGTFFNAPYKELTTNFSLAGKVAKFHSLRAKILGGSIAAEGEYAFKEATPHFALTTKFSDVDVKEIYAALDARAERDIQGRMNGDMRLAGSDKDEPARPRRSGDRSRRDLQFQYRRKRIHGHDRHSRLDQQREPVLAQEVSRNVHCKGHGI
jgi:uncharacterized protein involved in outer membrane biogenesis